MVKDKSIVRKMKPRTVKELDKALAYAFEQVMREDILGWFQHSGYV